MSFDKIVFMLVAVGALGLAGCCNNPRICSREITTFEEEVVVVEAKNSLLDTKVVYFSYDSYDSYDLTADNKETLSAHAKKLLANPTLRLRVIGHADERGGQAYNLELGKRRAQALAHELEHQGVPASQIEVVSYGKDKPAVVGKDEQAWSKNRRAELVYLDVK